MKRRLITIISLLLLISGTIAFGFWIFYSSKSSAGEIIAAKKEIAEIERREANIKELEDLISSIGGEEKKISGVFVGADNLVLFIEKLEAAARDSGVVLVIESAELSAGSKGDKEILPHFQFKTEGGFGDNFRYLQLLESMPFQIEIADAIFSVRSDEPHGKLWQLKASINLLSFLNK